MASHNRSYVWPVLSTLVAVVVLTLALPTEYRAFAPSFLRNADFHFGLDLAGGTQLDFRISEEEINAQIEALEQEIADATAQGLSGDHIFTLQQQLDSIKTQKETLSEAIRTVLERRINALGVSEAVITPSTFGNEKHLLVDCPGVVDVQQCIDTVGKTIQLEFKEEFTEATEEYQQSVRAKVNDTVARLRNGEDFTVVGEDFSTDIAVSYNPLQTYYQDQLPEGMEGIWNLRPESGMQQYNVTVQVPSQDDAGNTITVPVEGVMLAEIVEARRPGERVVSTASRAFEILAANDTALSSVHHESVLLDASVNAQISGVLTSMQTGELRTLSMDDGSARVLFLQRREQGTVEAQASHILVSYSDAPSAVASITRSREEAASIVLQVQERLEAGESFEALAREFSDAPSGQQGGTLGAVTPGSLGAGLQLVEQVIFSGTEGVYPEVVESAYGFHVVRVDTVPVRNPDRATYEELIVTGEDAANRAAAFITQMQEGQVVSEEDVIDLRTMFFSLEPTGWKDTLLDGKHFKAATVTLDAATNIPVVQIMFDDEGAELFQELTRNNIDKRIAIFVGGQLVSAPTVQQEITGGIAIITGSSNIEQARLLAQELNTGAIPAPIYLSGQRTVEATLGAESLQTSLRAALIGMGILIFFMILVYRLLGVLASIALSVYALVFLALLKLPLFLLTDQYIVLTLAGMAGIILSIGMAVDANVLIFERIKEELRKGKMLKTAAETGFKRAWPSIFDSNVSTLITCAILFFIGTSIVRGFAITLGIGVLISMLTAVLVTRWLVNRIARMPIAEKTEAFGVKVRS